VTEINPQEVILEPQQPEKLKKNRKLKDKAAKEKKEPRERKTIPANTDVISLAKAMWTELKVNASGDKEKVAGDKRTELWKTDKREYMKLARKVVNRLSRRSGRPKKRGEKSAEAGGAAP
jgi:hypothetical protein